MKRNPDAAIIFIGNLGDELICHVVVQFVARLIVTPEAVLLISRKLTLQPQKSYSTPMRMTYCATEHSMVVS
jgi:hypothetical protein